MYRDVQRRAQSEKLRGIEQEGHNSWGTLCFGEGGILHDRHGQRVFCTGDVLPRGIRPREKLLYAINSASQEAISPLLRRNKSCEWSQTQMARLPRKASVFFFLSFQLNRLIQGREGEKKSLSLETSPSLRSAFQLGVTYSAYSQTQSCCKMRLSTVHATDNFGSVIFFFF